jgi:HlyD family secretion protein
MNIAINRLDPNLPDPVESRRRAAGRLVRFVYGASVFGVLGFFVAYFGAPFVFLSGPGIVSAPRHVVSLPYTVQVVRLDVKPGVAVAAGDSIAQVRSPQQDTIVATYMQALAELAGRSAELRVKERAARESLEAAQAYQRVTQEAVERIEGSSVGTVTFRVEVLREAALKAVSPVAVSTRQLPASSRPISPTSASRWSPARPSPRSSIRPTCSSTGTFRTRG